ncbi:MAG TPA: hypothetical protein VES73_14470, partial [Lamprocystis sp. (in: g-proteobacteria)]|nr:hypothetical protein [Lamprocystis sp. (in: g-proteobacteria)]
GNGNWDRFQLVPLMQGDQPALVSLNGLETLRFDALSGDFDYLLFVNQTSSIPEPASAAVAAVGCLGFALILSRQKRRREGNPNRPG